MPCSKWNYTYGPDRSKSQEKESWKEIKILYKKADLHQSAFRLKLETRNLKFEIWKKCHPEPACHGINQVSGSNSFDLALF